MSGRCLMFCISWWCHSYGLAGENKNKKITKDTICTHLIISSVSAEYASGARAFRSDDAEVDFVADIETRPYGQPAGPPADQATDVAAAPKTLSTTTHRKTEHKRHQGGRIGHCEVVEKDVRMADRGRRRAL